jgi:DNA recombination protein RmuC
LLAAVKSEFGKFGDVLAKVKKKIDEASNQIELTEQRTRVINRKLRDVEVLPADQAAQLLPPASILASEEIADDEPDLPLISPPGRIDK